LQRESCQIKGERSNGMQLKKQSREEVSVESIQFPSQGQRLHSEAMAITRE